MRDCSFRLSLEWQDLWEALIPSTGTSKAAQASARPFIHSLNILVKHVRLYGPNHRRTTAQFEVAWGELRDAVARGQGAVVLGVSGDTLLIDGVPVESGHAERGFAQLLTASGLASIQFSSEVTREEFEKRFITKKLEEAGGNVAKAAERIGVERSHLYRKLRAYGIKAPATRAEEDGGAEP